jgi:hypothetical protein
MSKPGLRLLCVSTASPGVLDRPPQEPESERHNRVIWRLAREISMYEQHATSVIRALEIICYQVDDASWASCGYSGASGEVCCLVQDSLLTKYC